jgi:hypothetical protein
MEKFSGEFICAQPLLYWISPPFEEAREMFSDDNKGIIFWINYVIVLTI